MKAAKRGRAQDFRERRLGTAADMLEDEARGIQEALAVLEKVNV